MLGTVVFRGLLLAACLALPRAVDALPYVLVPVSIELGTTEPEFGTPTATGSAAFLTSFPDPSTEFQADLDLGSAIILNPNETSLFDIQATLSAGPTPVALVAGDFSATFDDLTLTLDGGQLDSIGFIRDFGFDPLVVPLPTTTVEVFSLDVLAGTSSFTLPLDLVIDVPGYPAFGPPASILLRGTFVFQQVPEPRAAVLLGLAALALRAASRRVRAP